MQSGPDKQLTSTFSIVARDDVGGDLGIAVASKYLAVGAVVSWAKARVGAIATQSRAGMHHGDRGLKMLADHIPPDAVIDELIRDDPNMAMRQIGIVDGGGRVATFTGEGCIPWAGGLAGNGFCCQGNILAGPEVVGAMASAFQDTPGELPERLVTALIAGNAAGGDRRGQQSAALYVVRYRNSALDASDRPIDLRVDDHPRPIRALQQLLALHRLSFDSSTDAFSPNESALVGLVQDQLRALGHMEGSHDGFDVATREALERFAADAQLHEWLDSAREIDLAILDALRDRVRAAASS